MKMPAGDYYIGDLCYVMKDEWDECCSLFFDGRTDHGCNEGQFTLKDGRRFVNFNTAYGDGEYETTTIHKIGVDSGSIGCILVSDIRGMERANILKMGIIYNFESDFGTSTDGENLRFGPVTVFTGNHEEDDYFD
jgi:hypothetical protein